MKKSETSPELDRAIKRIMSLPTPPKCEGCDGVIEAAWWNYCAMCGWHIAAGKAR